MSLACNQCGAPRSSGDACFRCGARLEPVATGVDARVASFPIRALARGIDYALGFVVGAIALAFALAYLTASGQPGDPNAWLASIQEPTANDVAASILGGTLYSALAEFIGGASLGKLLCGLRVTSQDFTRVTLLGTLVRSFALLIDGLFFGVVAYATMGRSPLRQRLGDRWGSTVVVHVKAFPESRHGAVSVFAGIAIGLAVFLAICAYSLATQMAAAMQQVA